MDFIDRTIGHYRLIECIGAGAMGEVYKADDLRLNRIVAIKFIDHNSLGADAETLLADEARAAARINHPNAATVYELGQHDETLFIAMEYCQGQTLAAKLKDGPLTVSETIDIASQI